MKFTELKQKSKEELESMRNNFLQRIDDLRFAFSQRKQKDVKEIANIKKDIARILTLLRTMRPGVNVLPKDHI